MAKCIFKYLEFQEKGYSIFFFYFVGIVVLAPIQKVFNWYVFHAKIMEI